MNVMSRWLPELRHFNPDTALLLVATKTDLRQDEEVLENLAASQQTHVSTKQGKHLARKIQVNKSYFYQPRSWEIM